jgi:hypothetical protein
MEKAGLQNLLFQWMARNRQKNTAEKSLSPPSPTFH